MRLSDLRVKQHICDFNDAAQVSQYVSDLVKSMRNGRIRIRSEDRDGEAIDVRDLR